MAHLSHFFSYRRLAVLLAKTFSFNKAKRYSHDPVLYIINIVYVFLNDSA